jgi:hypothetical protein
MTSTLPTTYYEVGRFANRIYDTPTEHPEFGGLA